MPLLANLGAVQLNYGMGVRECRQAVDMIGADALVLHLNALQEAIQPEGQCNFAGLLPKIGEVVREWACPWSSRRSAPGFRNARRAPWRARECASSIRPESAAPVGPGSRPQRART